MESNLVAYDCGIRQQKEHYPVLWLLNMGLPSIVDQQVTWIWNMGWLYGCLIKFLLQLIKELRVPCEVLSPLYSRQN